MSVDFGKLSSPSGDKLLSPRDIFSALPGKTSGFGYLRDVQGQVLDAWNLRRSERDVAIKMNTGTGKTIVGLLILRSLMNEGVVPALYVCPDNYLSEQVRIQARQLGIEVTDDPESARYLAGEAIGVVNIHKLMNGLSVFGGPGSARARPLPIGAVVVDDAHAALATVEQQSMLSIPSSHPAFSEVLDRFRDDLLRQSERALRDIEAGEPTAVLRVPYWAWSDPGREVGRILHEYRSDEDFLFAWPLVADVLQICEAVFSAFALEIKPPCPPIGEIESFANARHRIYLTATLADDSVLVTHFDADPQQVASPITPTTAADLGDRMILAPQEINPLISDTAVRTAARELADAVNVVVLVPSKRRADSWSAVADVVTAADGIGDVVEQLRSGHVGLSVLISKYDGIDLPGDACRVLILDGLPEAYGAAERREAQLLADTEAMVGRQLQRVEQGMGRGVRSTDDYCVILLVGARLSQLIAHPGNLAKLGPATRVQLELSKQVASQLRGRDLDEILAVIRQSLNRDPDWVTASRAALAGLSYGAAQVSQTSVLARRAFNAAAAGQFSDAADLMSEAVNLASEDREKGWLQEQLACYLHFVDRVRAQRTLAGAQRLNRRVLRPIEGVGYDRLRPLADQAAAAASFLADNYIGPAEMLLGVNALLDDLTFDPEHVAEFEDAMEALGAHLGYPSQRPERDVGNGPDVLWSVGQLKYFVIECKSGATAGRIRRRDVAQLSHSMNWFGAEYDSSCAATPVLVHPFADLEDNAVAPPGCRVVTRDQLDKLREAVRAVFIALTAASRMPDADSVAEQLRQHGLVGQDLLTRYSETPSS